VKFLVMVSCYHCTVSVDDDMISRKRESTNARSGREARRATAWPSRARSTG